MSQEDIVRYNDDFMSDWVACSNVRDLANEEFRFLFVPGGQWEGRFEKVYEDRAKMELNHMSAYLRRTMAHYTANRPSVNYAPGDGDTSEDLAELLDGVYRRDMIQNGGLAAQDTAVMEAGACGYGCEVLRTEYDDEGDPENDHQNIVAQEQPNAYSTVVWDASARRADKADAKRCTVLTPYTMKVFKEKWPDVSPSTMLVEDRSYFNWTTAEHIYVAELYEVDEEKVKVRTYVNAETGQKVRVISSKDTLQEESDLELLGYEVALERDIKRRSIYKVVYNRSGILEPRRRIVGQWIPVIPYYAFRAYVDGVEHFHGIARENMDSQRMLNMAASLTAETAATSSSDKPIFPADMMASPDVKAAWAENAHQAAYRIVDVPLNAAGDPIFTGPIGYDKGATMSDAMVMLTNMTSQSLRESIGGAPQDTVDPNSSGRALNAIYKRADMNTEMFYENINAAVKHKARVYASMAKEVYGGPGNAGRMIRTMQDSGNSTPVQLKAPSLINGQWLPINDLSKGRFDVSVSVSADYATQREETFEELKDIIAAISPEDPLRGVMLRLLITMKDAPGLNDVQERLRRDLLISGYVVPESEEDMAFLQQMQQIQGQQTDPNAVLLQAAALEQQTQAQLNEASIADKMASAADKAAKAEETKVDIALKKQQLVERSVQPQVRLNS